MRINPRILIGSLVLASLAGLVAYRWPPGRPPISDVVIPLVGAPGGPSTSRDDLTRTIRALESRWRGNGPNGTVAARLADALLRQARVSNNLGLAVRAEEVLQHALDEVPDHYEALQMRGQVLLSQHRFREAIAAAEHARRLEPRDAANLGVLGDAYLELGDYERAFDAFDEMMRLRPSAAAYARASYAWEIQGDLERALRLMQMAADAMTPHDPESAAWHRAQVGDLYFEQGRLSAALREYDRAAFIYPGHPFALRGRARVLAAQGRYGDALAIYQQMFASSPTPDVAAALGELYQQLGRVSEAEGAFALAENGWRFDTPEPAHLARLLATRERRIDEAVVIAERASEERRDIQTLDALAWSYFRAGRHADARRACEGALRTGTRDRRILYHAAAIHEASGDHEGALALASRALDGHASFDLVLAPAADDLLRRLQRKS
jgi:tetratricopeptide (TPR) repeat protein